MMKRFDRSIWAFLFLGTSWVCFPRAADAFLLPKEVLALGLLAFLGGRALSVPWKWNDRFWTIGWALLFLGWMLVDSVAVSLLRSKIWEGAVPLFLWVATLATVPWFCARGTSYRRLVHYALFAGVVMALLGLGQSLGLDRVLRWTSRFNGRVFSTLGNPDFLGGHLAALLPISFILGLRAFREGKGWRATGCMGILLLLVCGLVATRARGAELAFAGSFLFLLIGFLLYRGKELFGKFRMVPLLLLALFLVVGGWASRQGVGSWNLTDPSVQQRLETWKVTWGILQDHPWLGIGLGQLGLQYPAYQARPFQPAEYQFHPYTTTEHAHNEFLQIGVEGGCPGLLLFLGLLASFAMVARDLWKDPSSRPQDKDLLMGAAAGILAILIQSLGNFPLRVAPTSLLFGLFLAAPLSFKRSLPESGRDPMGARSSGPSFRALLPWIALVLAFGFGLRTLAASIAARDSLGEASLGNSSQAVYYGGRLAYLAPRSDESWDIYSKALEAAGKGPEALGALGKSLELNPNHVEGWTTQARLQMEQGNLQPGLAACEKAEKIAPNYAIPYWIQGLTLFRAGRFEGAAKAYEGFLRIAPNVAQARSNLGLCYLKIGRRSDAVEEWEKTLALDPKDPQALQNLKAQKIRR